MYLNTSIFGTVSVPSITAVSVGEEDYNLLLLYAMSLVEGWSYVLLILKHEKTCSLICKVSIHNKAPAFRR